MSSDQLVKFISIGSVKVPCDENSVQVLYVNSVETLTNHPTTPLTNHNNPLLHKSGKAGSWTLPLSRFRGQAPAVRACHSGNWQSSAGPHTLRRTAPNGASHGQTWLEEDTTSKTWFTGDPVPACFSFFFSVSLRKITTEFIEQ